MAFRFYGGSIGDTAATSTGAPTSAASLTVWTARTGGAQPALKDEAGTTITTVSPLSSGVDLGTVLFQADADGFDNLWLDRQDGSRRLRVELRDPAYAPANVGLTLEGTGVAATDTAALASKIASAVTFGVPLQLRNSFSVNDVVSWTGAVDLRMHGSTITQTGTNKATLAPGAGSRIQGGTLVGKTTDYAASTNTTPTIRAIQVTTANVWIRDVTITGHGGAGIYASGASGLRVSGVKVTGVGSTYIGAGDAACFGIYVNTGCTNLSIRDVEVSDCSIGIITSYDTTYTSITGANVHDIQGQHGLYIQNGTGLVVSGVHVRNTNLNGVKLQINASATADMVAASVSGITAYNCGDTGLSVNNVDTALTYKWRGLTVSNVTAVNCLRGVYFGSVRVGSLSTIAVYNSTSDGVTFVDCQNVALDACVLDTTGRVGVRFTGVTNGSNDGITITTLRTVNPGQQNVAGNLSGIYVNQCANLTIDGWKATSSNGFTDYSLFFASATSSEQQGFTLRNADLQGGTSQEIRLMSGPVAVREFDNVKLAVNQVLNYPSALVTRVGSIGTNTMYQSSAIPSGGTYKQGDICWNSAAAAAGIPGWYCVAAPSTWKAMAAIAA